MAVRETDDGIDLDTAATDLSTGHTCPDCGAAVFNGQGLYSCFECDFTLAPTTSGEGGAFDHPVFRL